MMCIRQLLLIFGILSTINLSAQKESIIERTDQIYDSLVLIRRDFHRHPELSGNEIRTSKIIKEYLNSLGIEVESGIGGHGVIGFVKGENPGKTIAWRADIDALKTEFPDTVDYKSVYDGIRHICGHDVHTTIGLGIANVLNTMKDEFDGTVMFIFQPSEENGEGAKSMIESGVFDRVKPDAIFTLHIAPIPSGKITVKAKEVYWRGKILSIDVEGREDKDIIAGALTQYLLQVSTVSQNSPYFRYNSFLSPENHPGNPNTIYRDYLAISKKRIIQENSEYGFVLNAEVEGSNNKNFEIGLDYLNVLIHNSDFKDRIRNVAYTEHYPTVYNDPFLTQASIEIISRNFGNEILMLPLYGISPFNNDDFAYFQKKVRGVYFFLGASSDFEKGVISLPHSPDFYVDEEAIRDGVNCFSTLLVEQLNAMNEPIQSK